MNTNELILNADAVSFDLWDTVLRRTCHPEALKRFSAGNLIALFGLKGVSVEAAYRSRLEAEAELASLNDAGEFTLRAALERWVARFPQICQRCAGHDAIVDLLEKRELDKELELAYADSRAAALLTQLGARAVYISDYYCSAQHIEDVLTRVGLHNHFAGGVVSCEEGESKRRGGLYPVAASKFPLTGRWVHVGDNPHSDVLQSQSHGARALLWSSPESAWLSHKAAAFHAREKGLLDWGGPALSASMGAWAYGQFLAPLVLGYCRELERTAQHHGARSILFLAREGLFFGKAFTMQSARATVSVDVSRRALFAASIADSPREGLERMWKQYAVQSPAALCATINASEADFRPLFEARGMPWEEPICGIATSEAFSSLYRTPLFQSKLTAHLAREQTAARGYIAQQLGESPKAGATYVVADVGWKGTIQDCLARLFPESTWVGVYCGLTARAQDPANAPKHGYIASPERDENWAGLLKETLPFELLFNAEQGSTLGYDLIDGRWWARYEPIGGESVVHRSFTRSVQNGCLAAMDEVRKAVHLQAVSDVELREIAQNIWRSVMDAPPDCLLRAGFALEHNEGFGVGAAVTFRRDFSWRELARAVVNRPARAALGAWLERMPWRRVVLKHPHTSAATRVALVLHHLRRRWR